MVWNKIDTDTATASVETQTLTLTGTKSNVILNHKLTTAINVGEQIFNADSGTNYANRDSFNGGADSTSVNDDGIEIATGNDVNDAFNVGYYVDVSGQEKLQLNWVINRNTAGTANTPNRKEIVSKYAETPSLTSLTIDYHAGGSANDAAIDTNVTVLGDVVEAPAAVGGWVEIGRTTLGSTSDSITVSSLADKRYYLVLSDAIQLAAANINVKKRVGNGSLDTGSNYSFRQSLDGAADTTGVSQTSISPSLAGSSAADTHVFDIGYWANLSSNEKLYQGWQTNVQIAGAGTSPRRREIAAKWDNTANVMDTIGIFNDDGGDYKTGSEVVVLGWDPTDTHTNNFWEELASVEITSAAATIDSGTITAKKISLGSILHRQK